MVGWSTFFIPFLFVTEPSMLMNDTWGAIAWNFARNILGIVVGTAGIVGFAFGPLSLPLRIAFGASALAILIRSTLSRAPTYSTGLVSVAPLPCCRSTSYRAVRQSKRPRRNRLGLILFVIGVCRKNYFGVVCLPLTIVTFFVSLIWIGQPIGYTAITMADVFASIFSVAYFATFALAMVDQGSHDS